MRWRVRAEKKVSTAFHPLLRFLADDGGLQADDRNRYLQERNARPKPFVWTASAASIPCIAKAWSRSGEPSGMRTGIVVNVTPADRERLAAIVANRNSPQKHVWRARIALLTAEGCGTISCAGVRWRSRWKDLGKWFEPHVAS
jgi:hypothetical protein